MARVQRSFHRSSNSTRVICAICSGNSFDRLVDPQPDRCIASDLRVVSEPLDKWCCRTCGAIRRRESGGVANLFDAKPQIVHRHNHDRSVDLAGDNLFDKLNGIAMLRMNRAVGQQLFVHFAELVKYAVIGHRGTA